MSGYRINARRKNRGGIPDRWLNYDAVGRDIEGTRFVPFKTPLDQKFFDGNEELHPDDYFDVRTLITFAREAGKKIGLVVDLTNTDRYYNKHEWSDYDIEYVKIHCPGHEVAGREDLVEEFINIVDNFIRKNQNDSLIGVHCTHGLNRTGYLICRYLIDKLGWTAERAISQFEYNRGHPIERGHYKKSLYEAWHNKLREPFNGEKADTSSISPEDTQDSATCTESTDSMTNTTTNESIPSAECVAKETVSVPTNTQIPSEDVIPPVAASD